MKKRVLSLFMAFVLCLTLLPAPALAVTDTADTQDVKTQGVAQQSTNDAYADRPDTNVATIGDTAYTSLSDALKAAEEGKTTEITLLDDVVETGKLLVNTAMTIHMDGHSITGDIDALDDLTLNDGEVIGNIKVRDLTVNNGTVVGNVEVNGNTFTMTAPADAEAAIEGDLDVGSSSSCIVRGAKIGVKGTLSFGGTNLLITGTEKAVELDLSNSKNPDESLKELKTKTFYGSSKVDGGAVKEASLWNIDGQSESWRYTYVVGDNTDVAKKLSNQQDVAVDSDGTYYTTIKDAIENAPDGSTVTIIAAETSLSLPDDLYADGTITLDLNGHRLEGSSLKLGGYIGSSMRNSNLTVIDSVGGGAIGLYVASGATVKFYGKATTTCSELAVYKNSDLDVKFYGGIIHKIQELQNVTYADLLPAGYCFYNYSNSTQGAAIELAAFEDEVLIPLAVAECSHLGVEGSKCPYCNATLLVKDNKGTTYSTLQEAIDAAAADSTIEWVRLDGDLAENVTFDKAGKTVTVNMNGRTLAAADNTGAALTVSDGTLIIEGTATIEAGERPVSAVSVTGGELIFRGDLTATGGAKNSSAAPAIEVEGGTVTFQKDVTATAVENAGIDTAIAPAIKVTGGKAIFNEKVTATGGLGGVTGNKRPCQPAVYADGGELEFNGDLDLNGGLTITGSAELTKGLTQGTFRIEYLKANGEAESMTGYAVSAVGSNVYKNVNTNNVNKLLADKHVFIKIAPKDEDDKYLTASYEYLAWNVTIEEHEHTWAKPESGDNYVCKVCGAACVHEGGYATGACAVCGKPCPHPTDVPRDGHFYCGTCGVQVYAYIMRGNAFYLYTSLKDALAAAEDGETVVLRDDVDNSNQTACIIGDGKTVTLDLRGHTITDGWINVGIGDAWDDRYSSTLKITERGSIVYTSSSGNLSIGPGATLDLSEWGGDTFSRVHVCDSSDVAYERRIQTRLTVGKNAGTIDELLLSNWQLGETETKAVVNLSGGTYNTICVNGWCSDQVTLGSLLAAGYAFKSTANDAPVSYNTKFSESAGEQGSINNLSVVKCAAHVTEGEDSRCIYCNTEITDATAFPIAVTVNGVTSRYAAADMQKAIDAAAADNGTVKLLADVTIGETVTVGEQQSLTLDLNGKTLTGDVSSESMLSVEGATVTICDGENNNAGGSIVKTNKQVGYVVSVGSLESSSSLTIKGGAFGQSSDDSWALRVVGFGTSVTIEGGKFENQVSANSGTLTITGGTFNSTVFIGDRGSAEISGGTFSSSLQNGNGGIGSLLAGGYGFKKLDGSTATWLTESELTATSVTNVTAAAAPIKSVTLTANTETVEYGLSKTVKLSFSYERLGGSDPTKVVTTTWYQVKDGVPENFENSSVFYTLPDNLDAGEYTYRITVKDNDSGYIVSSNDITVTVTKADLKNAVVVLTNPENQKTGEWTFYPDLDNSGKGSKLELEIDTITVNGMPVSEGDYAISGNTGTNVGPYTMVVTANGNSQNFKGEWTFDWEIVPHVLEEPETGAAVKTYDGTTDLPTDFWNGVGFRTATSEARAIRLTKDTDYEVTDAYYDSADVGDDKAVFYTIELTNPNYVFKDGQRTISIKYSKEVTTNTYKIEKADMQSESMTAGEAFTIVNKLSKTYEIELAEYLPALSNGCKYGDVTYDQLSVYLPGYYGNGAPGTTLAEIKDGKLILPILPNSETATGEVGEVQMTVTAANYKDFVLIIKVNAISKIEPTGQPTLSKDTLIYGEKLGSITLSGAMKDPNNGSEVTGTFEWLDPEKVPTVSDNYWADWKFIPDDTEAYLEIYDSVKITLEKATPTGAPEYTLITARGKTLADAGLTGTFSVTGTVQWVDKDGNALPDGTVVEANATYKWVFTPTDTNNYNTIEGSVKLYSVSTGGGGGSGTVTPPTTTETETTTDPDGTTTKTETKSDGSTVETVTKPDGSTTTTETKTETKPDGSTTTTETKSETNADGSKTETKSETTTAADGSKTETKSETKVEADGTKSETKSETTTDANGVTSGTETTQTTTPDGSTGTTTTTTENGNSKTEAEAKISEKAVEDAKQSGEAIKVPTEVKAGESSNSAPTVKVELPKDAGETKIEIPVSDVNSGTVAVIVHEDGTEEIVKSSTTTENGLQLKVDGSATIKVIDNSKTFDDTQNHWSRDEVNFVASRELFNGVGGSSFGVNEPMTRGMVNTVLARLAGVDTTTSGGSKWYEAGTAWAKDNGISDGTNPTANVTREQLAAMLYRFAGSPEVSGELNFADAEHVSGYAKNALLWAVQNGILNGIGDNLVAPKNNAERAQVAAMMARYLRNL